MEQQLLEEQIQLQRKLIRQLRLMNIWITLFGVILSVVLIVFVFFIYKAVSYVHTASDNISNIENKTSSTLDVQQQLCKDNSAFSAVIKDQTSICK